MRGFLRLSWKNCSDLARERSNECWLTDEVIAAASARLVLERSELTRETPNARMTARKRKLTTICTVTDTLHRKKNMSVRAEKGGFDQFHPGNGEKIKGKKEKERSRTERGKGIFSLT